MIGVSPWHWCIDRKEKQELSKHILNVTGPVNSLKLRFLAFLPEQQHRKKTHLQLILFIVKEKRMPLPEKLCLNCQRCQALSQSHGQKC